jgi:hypothetical protein
MPKHLQKVAFYTRKTLFWIFVVEKKVKKVSNEPVKVVAEQVPDSNLPKTCNFCNRCENCQTDLVRDYRKKKEKDEFDLNLSAVNYFVFGWLFLTIFSCNMGIWISIGN